MFTEIYGQLIDHRACVREHDGDGAIPERVVQCVWYDQRFAQDGLTTGDGQPLRIVSPGWWNNGEGPDFLGAQLEFGGRLVTGDVEIHFGHDAWRAHGHHRDSRYNDVVLVVVTAAQPPRVPPRTAAGRAVATLLLGRYLEQDLATLASRLPLDGYPYERLETFGTCAAIAQAYGSGRIEHLLNLAGDWRMLNRAQVMQEQFSRAGPGQALYEAILTACGYSRFKQHFGHIARQLPYDRARQLAREDPLLLEAGLLQIAGLLPESFSSPDHVPQHFTRLDQLRREHLGDLRSLPLEWNRAGVRPINYPERRLAGAARLVSRTSAKGLANALEEIWRDDLAPLARRKAFEAMFPTSAMGFWASHCTWTGKCMARPAAPIGPARVRSIIGNVFVVHGLALARDLRDRRIEERVFAFFSSLPKESDNQILRVMAPRVYGAKTPAKLTFRLQQGLLQMHQDWCEPNPSCRNCPVIPALDPDGRAEPPP